MAQSPSAMDHGKMNDDKASKNGMTTVTGCVADKDSKGHYMLNNAIASGSGDMSSSATGSTATGSTATGSTATGTTGATGTSGTMAMSYELSGGDLKAHVGHKVEVTGTVAPMQMDTMHKSDKSATSTTSGMDHGMMEHGAMAHTLKVKSVKMISESCQ